MAPPKNPCGPGNSAKTPYANGEIEILGRPFALRLNELDSIGLLFCDNIELKYGFIEILFVVDPKIQIDVQTLWHCHKF